MAAEMKSGQKKWLWIFFTIDFLNKIVSHIFITIVGPAQPFLAKKIGVGIDEINLIWTFCEGLQLSNANSNTESCLFYSWH